MITKYSNRGSVPGDQLLGSKVIADIPGKFSETTPNAIFLKVPNMTSASVYNAYDIKLNAASPIMAHIVPAQP